MLGFVFLTARQALAKAWKQTSIPFSEVKQRLLGTMIHEQLTSFLNYNPFK